MRIEGELFKRLEARRKWRKRERNDTRKFRFMMLIGVDYHPGFQTIAFFVEETGECGEQELNHSDGQAEEF